MMMSLGLYSNVWLRLIIIGIQVVERVNMKILGGVPSFHQNFSRYQFSHLLVLQLLSYVSNMDKMGKLLLAIIFTFGIFECRYFVCCSVFTHLVL